jgi:hypothetical protein
MEVNISFNYLAVLFVLWIAPVVSAIWGAPIWITISFMSFFAIYAGHEWMHVWICRVNKLHVEAVNLQSGGKTHILFEGAEGTNKNRIESGVYLVGVAWDSIWFTISILSTIFYSLYQQGEQISLVFGISLIFLLIFNLAMPGSDWQEFMKRTTKRA